MTGWKDGEESEETGFRREKGLVGRKDEKTPAGEGRDWNPGE